MKLYVRLKLFKDNFIEKFMKISQICHDLSTWVPRRVLARPRSHPTRPRATADLLSQD